VTDGEKMEGSCSTGQSPQWALVPVEEEEKIKAYVLARYTVLGFSYMSSVISRFSRVQELRLRTEK
jgi:hypothetical protein